MVSGMGLYRQTEGAILALGGAEPLWELARGVHGGRARQAGEQPVQSPTGPTSVAGMEGARAEKLLIMQDLVPLKNFDFE